MYYIYTEFDPVGGGLANLNDFRLVNAIGIPLVVASAMQAEALLRRRGIDEDERMEYFVVDRATGNFSVIRARIESERARGLDHELEEAGLDEANELNANDIHQILGDYEGDMFDEPPPQPAAPEIPEPLEHAGAVRLAMAAQMRKKDRGTTGFIMIQELAGGGINTIMAGDNAKVFKDGSNAYGWLVDCYGIGIHDTGTYRMQDTETGKVCTLAELLMREDKENEIDNAEHQVLDQRQRDAISEVADEGYSDDGFEEEEKE